MRRLFLDFEITNMKNILYYLDPSIELNDPLFREGTLKSIIIPSVNGIKNFSQDLNVGIVLSDIYSSRNHNFSHFNKVFFINSKEYSDIFLGKSVSEIYYNNNSKKEQDITLKKILLDKIGDFSPEVIICYEACAPFLKDIFPEALILNEMFGSFSRAPFPSFAVLDHNGVFGKSFQATHAERYSEIDLSEEEQRIFNNFKKTITKNLSTNLPFKSFIDDIQNGFDSNVLLACQIDGYFAYDACCDFDSQYAMVDYVLKKSDPRVGVIVTEHGYKAQLKLEEIEQLRKEYQNFIYLENKERIPYVSQFLLPYIDGVIGVSSSVIYQAALWGKPIYVAGKSQINFLQTSNNIDEFFHSALEQEYFNQDKVLYNYIASSNYSYRSEIFKGENFYRILFNLYNNFINGDLDNVLKRRKNAEEMNRIFSEDSRGWLLKEELAKYSSYVKPDYLRIGMAESRAISFDLFDTLAERAFAEPHELFLFIEPTVQRLLKNRNFRFHYFRRQAEGDTRRPTRGDFEITLDQIYEQFQKITGLDNNICLEIKKIEINAEIEIVQPKRKMIREFNFSKNILDNVSVITDIYLDKSTIEKLLEKIGVKDYDDLLVSAETKTRKHNGTIYPEYLKLIYEKIGVSSNRCLHVGDNEVADGTMAKKFGMKTYVFPKAMDNYKKSMLGKTLMPLHGMGGISSSILNGVVANKFNAAHWNRVNSDSCFNGSPYAYGYAAMGPLVYGFIKWLYRQAKKDKINNLYFLARDGWLLKQVYDEFFQGVSDAPASHYLYCSRRSVMVASLKDVNCIRELADQSFNARTLDSFLENRFGIAWNSRVEAQAKSFGMSRGHIVAPIYEQDKLHAFLKSISDVILDNAEQERFSYVDYLDEAGFLSDIEAGNAAVVDIGYSGSMQFYLKKMLDQSGIAGYYFLTHHHSRDYFSNDIFEGFLENLDDHRVKARSPLNDHVFIFEAALSSPEGSLLKFEGVGGARVAKFMAAEEEERRKYLLSEIHRGARKFVSDLKSNFGCYRMELEFSPRLSSFLMFNFSERPSRKDAGMFLNFEVENNFGGGSVCLVQPLTTGITPDAAIEVSKWKQGARAFYLENVDENKEAKRPIAINNKTQTLNRPKKTTEDKLANDRSNRKLAKLRNRPYMFFHDSKKNYLRPLRHLVDEATLHGRFISKAIRKVI